MFIKASDVRAYDLIKACAYDLIKGSEGSLSKRAGYHKTQRMATTPAPPP